MPDDAELGNRSGQMESGYECNIAGIIQQKPKGNLRGKHHGILYP